MRLVSWAMAHACALIVLGLNAVGGACFGAQPRFERWGAIWTARALGRDVDELMARLRERGR